MYCVNCGKEISDDSKFCTSCGKSTKVETCVGKITFHRLPRYMGFAVGIDVYIDGTRIGTVNNNGTVEANVTFGTHKIYFSLWSGSNEEEITVTEEKPNVYVDIRLKMGAFTNKTEIVNIRRGK